MPNITALATTAELNDVKNKIPNISDLVKQTDYDATIRQWGHKENIAMQKCQRLRLNILSCLVIINLRIKQLMQKIKK